MDSILSPGSVTAGSAVEFVHPHLSKVRSHYRVISDCLDGELAVKARGPVYLPVQGGLTEASPLYQAYLTRAVFYPVTRRTLEGLIGQIFLREPNVEVPNGLDPVIKDVNGLGVTVQQLSKETAKEVLAKGRAGLYVDYPKTEGPATVADLQEGFIRSTITLYKPEDIINWDVKIVGAKSMLSLVVLAETFNDRANRFEIVCKKQFRVLFLDDAGIYQVEVFREDDLSTPYETFTPLDASGKPFREIKFTFVGVNKNDHHVDYPPLYDLSSLNLAHFRNSADHEESSYKCGQPSLSACGLEQDWIDANGNSIRLGATAALLWPVGVSEVQFLQADPNTQAFAGMEHKERQMVALGAKLVEAKTVQRTATEASLDNSSETSILSSVAHNVGAAFTLALEWCGEFMGVAGDVSYGLNTEFDLVQMDANDRAQLLKEWQSGAIAFSEMRDSLKRAGIASLDDEEAQAAIAEEQAKAQADAMAQLEQQTAITSPDPEQDPEKNAQQPADGGKGVNGR